jgi:hypothetical protein
MFEEVEISTYCRKFNLEASTPKTIYTGIRFGQNENSLESQILHIAKSQGILVFPMKFCPTEYKLTV